MATPARAIEAEKTDEIFEAPKFALDSIFATGKSW